MPHTPRSILLAVCLALLLLPSADAKDDPAPRAKVPGPMVLALPPDPAALPPEQLLKQERGAAERVQRAARATLPAGADAPGIRPVPIVVSPEVRAEIEARLQAKIEAVRAFQGTRSGACAASALGPIRTKSAHVPSIILTGPPGLTASERAKLEATRAATPSGKEAGQ